MSRAVRAPRAARERAVYEVESLDLEGHGVARHDGKVAFVHGALPGERVEAEIVRRKPRFDVAETRAVLREHALRVQPRCPHFGVCGGCSMQHLESRAQVSVKQRALEDTLWHLGRVRAQTMLRPLVGPAWGYRFRARLSVRDVAAKGGVLVGFHERASSFVADIRECHVVPPAVSALLLPLRELVGELSIRRRAPQIELAVGEARDKAGRPQQVIALVLRVLDPPTAADRERLRAFGAAHGVEWWLQPKGPDTAELLGAADGETSRLAYRLDEFGIVMRYRPTDFTQVNHAMNASLVSQAVGLIGAEPGDRVADLFCGLGNFTLPLATRARSVLGIEGSAGLLERAAQAASDNGLADRVEFRAANLFELTPDSWAALGRIDRVLVDPPREGALALAKALCAPGTVPPRRVVYVSCNPATLARDLGVLANEGGWTVKAAGVVDMFPQTSHVESMAVLEPHAAAVP